MKTPVHYTQRTGFMSFILGEKTLITREVALAMYESGNAEFTKEAKAEIEK
jgi:hypothetical protein